MISSSRDSRELAIEASPMSPYFQGIEFSSGCHVPRWCGNPQLANVSVRPSVLGLSVHVLFASVQSAHRVSSVSVRYIEYVHAARSRNRSWLVNPWSLTPGFVTVITRGV
ncbi:hypothetical protein TNCV_3579981 [Trichonephila clavipes]|nr:hypothetical protein TNCV_3579981 [Trichonephila clavipes]